MRARVVIGLTLPPDAQRRAELAGITEPQHAVLQLLAEGLSLKEMTARLGPGSARTIGATAIYFRLQRAMKTLGARTPEQAVAIAFRRGILR